MTLMPLCRVYIGSPRNVGLRIKRGAFSIRLPGSNLVKKKTLFCALIFIQVLEEEVSVNWVTSHNLFDNDVTRTD